MKIFRILQLVIGLFQVITRYSQINGEGITIMRAIWFGIGFILIYDGVKGLIDNE